MQFQLTADLVESAALGRRVDWVAPAEFPALREKYKDSREWLVFKNHTCTPAMAAEFERGNARGVYVYRDLRDVVVSLMKKNEVSFETVWRGPFLANCLRNHQQWTQLPGVLVTRYEDMIRDLSGEAGRIASHLDIPSTPEQLHAIASRYGLDQQRQRIADARREGILQKGFGQDEFEPKSNLHTNHIHSGGCGNWREVLTKRQVALVEEMGRNWLPRHGYPLSTSKAARQWAALQNQFLLLPQKLRRNSSR